MASIPYYTILKFGSVTAIRFVDVGNPRLKLALLSEAGEIKRNIHGHQDF